MSLASAANSPASADEGDRQGHFTALRYHDYNWQYLDVSHGALPTFPGRTPAEDAFIDTQAGFGTKGRGCNFGNPARPTTYWQPGTDLLLRRSIGLAGFDSAQGTNDLVSFTATLKGSADIYVDGELVKHVTQSSCHRSNVTFSAIPDDSNFISLDVRATGDDSANALNYIDFKAVDYFTQYGCEDC